MSAQRWILTQQILQTGNIIILPDDVAQQIRTVLRLHLTDTIILCDGHGNDFSATITEISRERVAARITDSFPVHTEPHVAVTIYQGLIKSAKFEWIVQKGAEIGAVRFVPIQTAHSIKGLEEVSTKKRERWQSIAREAAEQCGRAMIPAIDAPLTFTQALADAQLAQKRLIPWEIAHKDTDKPLRISDALRYTQNDLPRQQSPSVAIFIGPEGGFTLDEISQAVAMNIIPVTLGSLILRAETAALVALTLAINAHAESEM